MKLLALIALFPLTCLADGASDLKAIGHLAASMTSNGYVSKVTKYNPAKYTDYDEQKLAVLDFIDGGGCADGGIKPRANMRSNFALFSRVAKDGIGSDDEALKQHKQMMTLLSDVAKAKNLKAFLSVSWDEKEEAGEHADGVSCSVYLFRFFTNDGAKMTIVFSHTD